MSVETFALLDLENGSSACKKEAIGILRRLEPESEAERRKCD